MLNIRELMANHHRQCDDGFAAVEQAVAKADWAMADQAFGGFRTAMVAHFEAEEMMLFPLFEAKTGMTRGPTQVMRAEHAQILELIEAAGTALAAQDGDDYSGYAETLLIMTQQHNMKEENILYPMCDQHLVDELEKVVATLKSKLAGQGEGR